MITPKLRNIINKYSLDYGFDPQFIEAIMAQESGGRNLTSKAGAKGEMQVLGTAPIKDAIRAGKLKTTPNMNTSDGRVQAGVAYLATLRDHYGASDPGQLLMMYNGGPKMNQYKGDITRQELDVQKYQGMYKKDADNFDTKQNVEYRDKILSDYGKRKAPDAQAWGGVSDVRYSTEDPARRFAPTRDTLASDTKLPQVSSTPTASSTATATTTSTRIGTDDRNTPRNVVNDNTDIRDPAYAVEQQADGVSQGQFDGKFNEVQNQINRATNANNTRAQSLTQRNNAARATIDEIDPKKVSDESVKILEEEQQAMKNTILQVQKERDALLKDRQDIAQKTYGNAGILPGTDNPKDSYMFDRTSDFLEQNQADVLATAEAAKELQRAPIGSRGWFARVLGGNPYVSGGKFLNEQGSNVTDGFKNLQDVNTLAYNNGMRMLEDPASLNRKSEEAIALIRSGTELAKAKVESPLKAIDLQTKLNNSMNAMDANEAELSRQGMELAKQSLALEQTNLSMQGQRQSIKNAQQTYDINVPKQQQAKVESDINSVNNDKMVTTAMRKMQTSYNKAYNDNVLTAVDTEALKDPEIRSMLVDISKGKTKVSSESTRNALLKAKLVAYRLRPDNIAKLRKISDGRDTGDLSVAEMAGKKAQVDAAKLEKALKDLNNKKIKKVDKLKLEAEVARLESEIEKYELDAKWNINELTAEGIAAQRKELLAKLANPKIKEAEKLKLANDLANLNDQADTIERRRNLNYNASMDEATIAANSVKAGKLKYDSSVRAAINVQWHILAGDTPLPSQLVEPKLAEDLRLANQIAATGTLGEDSLEATKNAIRVLPTDNPINAMATWVQSIPVQPGTKMDPATLYRLSDAEFNGHIRKLDDPIDSRISSSPSYSALKREVVNYKARSEVLHTVLSANFDVDYKAAKTERERYNAFLKNLQLPDNAPPVDLALALQDFAKLSVKANSTEKGLRALHLTEQKKVLYRLEGIPASQQKFYQQNFMFNPITFIGDPKPIDLTTQTGAAIAISTKALSRSAK